jgi:hypothetical protein
MLRRLLALPVGIAIAQLAATRRLAVALDDLAALAEHARAQPAALATIERRVDRALLQIEALNEQLRRLHGDLVVVDAAARALAAVGSTLRDGGADLLAATRDLHDGGADLLAATRDLHGDARDLSDRGRELVVVGRRLDQALGVIRAALPRMLAGLDTVENLEDAVETVAETVEPLQGAAERVGRVTSRLGRRSG